MTEMPIIRHRFALGALCTALLAGLAGCETVTTAPPDSQLSGTWRIEPSASEDPEAKVAKVMAVAEAKMHKALARYGYGPDEARDLSAEADDNAPDAPDYSFDSPGDRFGGPGRVGPDFRGLRFRLRQALTPPMSLQLNIQDDLVTITSNQLPSREYRLGERISRFDEYGTAVITATWSHQMFELKSSYTSRASRLESYQVDPATGALTLTQQIVDPTVGKIILHTLYRRG
jgi:hypothetical protein